MDYHNKIICGDCLEILPKLPDNSIDLILTDPPFSIPTRFYQTRDKRFHVKFSDFGVMAGFFKQIVPECKRLLNWDGHLLVFCDCVSYPTFFAVTYGQFDYVRALIWDKGEGHFTLGTDLPFRYRHEMLLHARNVGCSYNKANRYDVMTFPVVPNKDRTHPAEKPLLLLKHLIEALTSANGFVLDCFAGTGATCVAAKDLGRSYIGIELDLGYCAIAEKRLAALPNTRLETFAV